MQIIARERNEHKRAEFRRLISQFQPEQFIFIDESSKDKRTTQVQHNTFDVAYRVNVIGVKRPLEW